MLIGVLSDSHGRAAITARAVSMLLAEGAETLIHLGDIETDAVIDELVGHHCHLVLGNCDWPEEPLIDYARSVDVIVDHPAGRLNVDGRSVVFTHGHLESVMQGALAEGVDYLLHGHTHVARDERVGRTRVINPGALFRASGYTAALLDPTADSVRFLEIPKELG